MIHTPYSHLTNPEFLRLLHDKLGKSTIIDECIRRLEDEPCGDIAVGYEPIEEPPYCEVCGAKL